MNKWVKLIICISLPLLIGGVSGFLTSTEIPNWYNTLIKPSFNPPNYLFGPVWSLLYTLMGISLFLVLNKSNSDSRKKIILVFSIQLLLNFMWSFIFFKFHLIELAFLEILLLWLSIIAMILVFYKIDKWASFLNLPYLAWVSFAACLNYSFYLLNSTF